MCFERKISKLFFLAALYSASLSLFLALPAVQAADTGAPPVTTGGSPSLYKESLRVGVKPSCWSDGQCSVEDFVMTGAAFANILIELSGALFLLSFIYGGARYLMSFGNKSSVEKGTTAMKGGAIGMLIVMAAWTIVNYLVKALSGT